MHYAEEKKPNSKTYVLHDSIRMTFQKRQKTTEKQTKKHISGCQGWEQGNARTTQGYNRIFQGDASVLHFDDSGGHTTISVCQNSQNHVLKRMTFIVCKTLIFGKIKARIKLPSPEATLKSPHITHRVRSIKNSDIKILHFVFLHGHI